MSCGLFGGFGVKDTETSGFVEEDDRVTQGWGQTVNPHFYLILRIQKLAVRISAKNSPEFALVCITMEVRCALYRG